MVRSRLVLGTNDSIIIFNYVCTSPRPGIKCAYILIIFLFIKMLRYPSFFPDFFLSHSFVESSILFPVHLNVSVLSSTVFLYFIFLVEFCFRLSPLNNFLLIFSPFHYRFMRCSLNNFSLIFFVNETGLFFIHQSFGNRINLAPKKKDFVFFF